MTDLYLLPVGGDLYWTFDFTDEISAPGTLVSVTITSALTLEDQSDDVGNKQSSVRITGAQHGITYTVTAVGLTSTGEDVVKSITIRGWAGA